MVTQQKVDFLVFNATHYVQLAHPLIETSALFAIKVKLTNSYTHQTAPVIKLARALPIHQEEKTVLIVSVLVQPAPL